MRLFRFLPWFLVTVLALMHIWLATLRTPYHAGVGLEIHAPAKWFVPVQDHFRISTYNIHRGKTEAGDRDITRSANVLKQDDIAGLQEVLGPGVLSNDQTQQLGELNGVGWLFAPIQKQYYQQYIGNGLLSRFPVKRWQRVPLPKSDRLDDEHTSRAYRNMLTAIITLNEIDVAIIVTHLDRGPIRVKQLRQVFAEMGRYSHAVLLADLNTRINTPVINELIAEFGVQDAIAITSGENDDEKRIDYVLTKGMEIFDGGVEPEGVSDHPYYWVNLVPQ